MASDIALVVVPLSVLFFVYTYFGYPALLWVLGSRQRGSRPREGLDEWPTVSLSVPVYNEAVQIRSLLESLLALDYPRDRLQLLIISDGSTDGTDEIVEEYADRGVELLRMPVRGGKTEAERAASEHLLGEIVVNTDASIRIIPGALKLLVAGLSDPSVGCASGRDVSLAVGEGAANIGESGYVGYEMAVRDLETRLSGIVGASGCFYAIRSHLHRVPLPPMLSRDFAAALHAKEHGYRSISVPEAVCLVPRVSSLRSEYSRKVRTITRGMQTLWHKRALMNPFKLGVFGWMLFSHKVCRWSLPWVAMLAFLSLGVLARNHVWAGGLFAVGTVLLLLAFFGWRLSDRRRVPKLFSIPAFLIMGNLAAAHAFLRVLRGYEHALWEPTRRDAVEAE